MVTFVGLITFLFFFFKGIIFLDPDFGWHLKMGEIITSFGIPKADPFSYTMSTFPFIDHEWLSNVFIHIFHSSIGIWSLSFVFAIFTFGAIYLSLKRDPRNLVFWELPVVLSIGILYAYFGVRPQVESWLLWAIFLAITLNEKRWKKWNFFLPILFLIWVNLHGSFAVGLVTLFIIGALRFWAKRKLEKDYLKIFIASLLVTFINPYGPRIWHEVWLQVSDSSLRLSILEWQPAFFSFNLPFVIYSTLSASLIWRQRDKFKLEELGLYLFFLILGISSVRHVPLWIILSLPLTIKAIRLTFESTKKIQYAQERFNKVYGIGLYGAQVILAIQFFLVLGGAFSFSESRFYPKEALSYIKENLPKGEIFSEYGWGGYLDWKLPEKKVFIDGRMPSWRWKGSPENESGYAMKDYKNILSGKVNYSQEFEKYNIDTLLWPRHEYKGFFDTISEKLTNVLFKEKKGFDLVGKLEADRWKKVYEDKVAVIYKKLE